MDAKTIQKYQKYSLPKLIKEAEKVFNTFIRERDRLKDLGDGQYFYCPTCRRQKRIIGDNYQACHCFPGGEGKYLWHKFNEDNVFGGCKHCNYYQHGTNYEYNDWVRNKIGEERYQKLLDANDYFRRNGYKWDRFTLIEIIEKYK
jgi:hypothetical protein